VNANVVFSFVFLFASFALADTPAAIGLSMNRHHMSGGVAACKRFVARAAHYGFNVITVTPTFIYDEKTQESTPVLPQGLLEKCIDEVTARSIEVVYRPMMEPPGFGDSEFPAGSCGARRNPHGTGRIEGKWRAFFRIKPDLKYMEIVFGDYLRWLSRLGRSVKTARVVLTSELLHSTTMEAAAWNDLLWNLKKEAKRLNPNVQFFIGFDPGVLASYHNGGNNEGRQPMSAEQCRDFHSLLWSADFYSYSAYGDLTAGKKDGKFHKALSELVPEGLNGIFNTFQVIKKCSIDPLLKRRYLNDGVIAETGFAGDLEASYKGRAGEFAKSNIRAAFVDWATDVVDFARKVQPTPWRYTSFWNLGDFDFLGMDGCSSLGDPMKKPNEEDLEQVPELIRLREILK
jgi:hypothetical protein